MQRVIVALFLSIFIIAAPASETAKPLAVNQAFVLTPSLDDTNQLVLEWTIAPDYYLYRQQFAFSVAPDSAVKLGHITLPPGQAKTDQLHGHYQAYTKDFKITVPLVDAQAGVLKLNISYQGCSAKGFCYPPVNRHLNVNLTGKQGKRDLRSFLVDPSAKQNGLMNILMSHSPVWMILSFFGMGVLLAFTPCVLPMIPILSGIIIGRKKSLKGVKAFSLTLAYVLGMAVTYALAGVAAALLGVSLQSWLQNPVVLSVFSLLFVSLAFSLFGFYQLHLPSKWLQKLNKLSHKQKNGTFIGDFLLGSLSSLIVSPCITPPLVGVLTYIADTGDAVFGAISLLALGIGMGVPLLLVGASFGKILPKAGPWMQSLEHMFGVFMLLMAVWIVSRVIPGNMTLFLYATILICSTSYFAVFAESKRGWFRLVKGFQRLVFIYGVILFVGAISGNSDPLRPLENWSSANQQMRLPFTVPISMLEFDRALELAKLQQKPVLLDFYAAWCQTCVTQDRYILTNRDVRRALTDFVLLRADVTANNAFDQALMQRFHVVAPPAIVFFNQQGQEVTSRRIDGEANAKELLVEIAK